MQRVKITDFGLARAMDDASMTQSGFVAGSPLYMAPEQARGEALDHRADLFSLGSVLYTLCTGRPPFRAANTLAVLRRVAEESPRPIRETNPEVPDWLAAIVARLQAKDPAERFQSAGELVELLGQHLARLQHRAPVPPAPSPAPAGGNASTGLPTSLTICPSCGASLHVPESMVGSLVHCQECGKPFQVVEGSEVIRVARSAPSPLGPGFVPRHNLPRWLWIAGGCAALLFLLILLAIAANISSPLPAPAEVQAPSRWNYMLGWLPAEATLFGSFDFQPFGPLTLESPWTQVGLRLLVPGDTSAPTDSGKPRPNPDRRRCPGLLRGPEDRGTPGNHAPARAGPGRPQAHPRFSPPGDAGKHSGRGGGSERDAGQPVARQQPRPALRARPVR